MSQRMIFAVLLSACTYAPAQTQPTEEYPSHAIVEVGFKVNFVQGRNSVDLPIEARQFTYQGQTLTFANTGSFLPRAIIAEIPLEVGYRFGRLGVQLGPDFVRPNLFNIYNRAGDRRGSSLPDGGQAEIQLRYRSTWKVGIAGEIAYAITPRTDVVFDPSFLPIEYEARLLVNNQEVSSGLIFKETLSKYMAGIHWRPSVVGIKFLGGAMTGKSFRTAPALEFGLTFGRH